MIKRAPRPDQAFVILRNEVVRDARLSYRASGVLHAILSRPDNWTTSAEQLARERPGSEGVKAIRRALRELEQHGYLKRERMRGSDGRFTWVQTVYDAPIIGEPESFRRSHHEAETAGRFTTDGKPPDGFGPSKEEPTRTTEEEDVTGQDCPVARFARAGATEEDHINAPIHERRAATDRKDLPDWRTEDRALFEEIIGPYLAADGTIWNINGKPATVTTVAFYNAFRQTTRPGKRLQWPGRFVQQLHERGGDTAVEDWLITQGLTPT